MIVPSIVVIENSMKIFMDIFTRKFDRSCSNSEIEPFLAEIEKLDELSEIIKI